MRTCRRTMGTVACLMALCLSPVRAGEDADLILHHGKIVTVDKKFSIQQALAVRDGKILRVGGNDEVLKTKGPHTQLLNLEGKMVLPGLIDSHVHPNGACMIEFDHPIPEMETIADVLAYIKDRAKVLSKGEWIEVRQVFITRLREQRYPARRELDEAAPDNPVVFSTGPDASLNTLALKLSGIDKDFKVRDGGPGYIEKDERGEPTGILRSCTRYVKSQPSGRQPTELDRTERLLQLLKDYASVGLTTIGDRDAYPAAITRYRKLHDNDKLLLRVAVSHHIDTIGAIDKIQQNIRRVAEDALVKGDDHLRIVGIKTYLDGGMLTGSAYMRRPWGVSKIYSIKDPDYRGVLFIPKERLLPIVRTTIESGLQFTAHSVGDGAVHTLLAVYEELARKMPIRKVRPCITHCNFMSAEAVRKLTELGVVADLQPAWLYLDTRTLTAQFGYDRLRYFQPLKSLFEAGAIAGGGSDHMQKIGSLCSVNPYNPFLGMWTTITRKAKWYEGRLHPEEALSREQAIRFYTINNAYILFLDERVGSLEAGKLADLIVLDRDLLTCSVDDIKDARVLRTFIDGKLVYTRSLGARSPPRQRGAGPR
jgi:predicted amidohydrolase YtcJ